MIREGDLILFEFPKTDLKKSKLRPALVLKKLPGKYNDWLICMISSRIHQYNNGLDIIISTDDKDFKESGLKITSVIRVSRLAVVDKDIMIGKIGKISLERLKIIKEKICNWIKE